MYAFKVGDRVIITPEAMTSVGECGVVTVISGDCAVVLLDNGQELGFLLDDGELALQESMPSIVQAFAELFGER